MPRPPLNLKVEIVTLTRVSFVPGFKPNKAKAKESSTRFPKKKKKFQLFSYDRSKLSFFYLSFLLLCLFDSSSLPTRFILTFVFLFFVFALLKVYGWFVSTHRLQLPACLLVGVSGSNEKDYTMV